MIQTDCMYYKGEVPCQFHKKYKVECNEKCSYYKKIKLRILIIKKDAIGDVVRTTPILHSIKKKFKEETQITWLTDPNAVDILMLNPLINRVLGFDFKTVLQLEMEEFDIIYNLDKDPPTLALAKKILAKQKYGFTMNKYGNLITFNEKEQYAHLLGISDTVKKNNKKTYVEIVTELLELPYSKDFKYILNIPDKEELIRNLCQKYKLPTNIIIIGFNTGAGIKYQTKIWPKEYFIQIGIKLIKEKNVYILLFGAQSEDLLNKSIHNEIKSCLPEKLKSNIINTGTNNTLCEFASLISLCNLIITGDTLGLHFAIALGIPSISFFGPTSASEIDLYVTGVKIVANSPCLMCYKAKCDYQTFCLSKILPDEVFKMIIDHLNSKASKT